jgi:hypothetical protein
MKLVDTLPGPGIAAQRPTCGGSGVAWKRSAMAQRRAPWALKWRPRQRGGVGWPEATRPEVLGVARAGIDIGETQLRHLGSQNVVLFPSPTTITVEAKNRALVSFIMEFSNMLPGAVLIILVEPKPAKPNCSAKPVQVFNSKPPFSWSFA